MMMMMMMMMITDLRSMKITVIAKNKKMVIIILQITVYMTYNNKIITLIHTT